MVSNLIWIVLIAVLAALFWQQRRQSEIARKYIEMRCEQLNLQVVSIARGEHSFTWFKAPFSVTTKYYFEFSVNGLNCYQGYAMLKGNRLQEFFMPPYPI